MKDDIQSYVAKRRRKRSWAGSTWTPPSMSAHKEDGEWCRICKTRHGYMTMGINYTKNSKGNWVILWSCPKTHDVIAEKEMLRKEE